MKDEKAKKKTSSANKKTKIEKPKTKKTVAKPKKVEKETIVDEKIEKEEIQEEKVEQPKQKQEETKSNKNNYGFKIRIITSTIIFLLLLVAATFFLTKALEIEEDKIINYNEKSNLNYQVYLKKNDFYETPYLEKDMLYVASLIDKININFNYNFAISEKENIDLYYTIYGKLIISNKDDTKSYYEKTYKLSKEKIVQMRNELTHNINENINIKYGYYNNLANKFKDLYGIDAQSKLNIYMVITKKGATGSDLKLNSSSNMNIEIPLTEKSVEIDLDYKDLDQSSDVIKTEKDYNDNIINLAIAVTLITIAIVIMITNMRKAGILRKKKSAYDKYVKKLLKEYDRLIAESSSLISFDDKEVIKIEKFSELLDIHDNLAIPIMYCPIAEHQKCYFYISHENIIYLHVVKAVDMEKKHN